jgi:hypothetical protein
MKNSDGTPERAADDVLNVCERDAEVVGNLSGQRCVCPLPRGFRSSRQRARGVPEH